MPKFFTMRLCMGGGHFDNRADEEYFQEKEENQKKDISNERSSLQS